MRTTSAPNPSFLSLSKDRFPFELCVAVAREEQCFDKLSMDGVGQVFQVSGSRR